MVDGFYSRPMVRRLSEIFGEPKPPPHVTQEQFDYLQDILVATAGKAWHDLEEKDYWYYLDDLCYSTLQQDLFDYLFPALLIRWWEGQLNRMGGPGAEVSLYRGIRSGELLVELMDTSRRERVIEWIADAYMEGVDAWSGELSVNYRSDGPQNLHGPLEHFNGLGQSVPLIGKVLKTLSEVSTTGRAQWWLVYVSGLVWEEGRCPFVPPSHPVLGGGGVYMTMSAADIYDHGFLAENLEAMETLLAKNRLANLIGTSANILATSPHAPWAQAASAGLLAQPDMVKRRLKNLIYYLGKPHLGEVRYGSLDSIK